MDRDFFNTIQPNFDYLSESLIWKNNLMPSMGESFVVPTFNSAAILFNNKPTLLDNFAFAANAEAINLKTGSTRSEEHTSELQSLDSF
jgi:hypothetical protein